MPDTTGPSPSTVELHFPYLTGGVLSTAPPRALSDPAGQFIWRDSLNMIPRDGVVIGRPGITDGWPSTQPPAPPTISGVDTTELPRYINTFAGQYAVVITNRQAYLLNGSGWHNVTPTYTTGTVTATNGSTAVTLGGGGDWSSVHHGYITMSGGGGTYELTVTGATTGTLSSNYTGTTGAGKTHTVVRTFGLQGNGELSGREIYAVVYNETLYYAGSVMAGPFQPVVVAVRDIFGASPTTEYITSGLPLVSGLDYISGLYRIAGLAVLQDGRVVIAGNVNEVFYSSHLDDTVWTTAPGGSTPLADVDGILTAVGRIGSTLTFHHPTGVVFGDPTNIVDPPLRFQASPATMGAVSPLTLYSYAGGEVFVADDGDVKLFDGNQVRSLGDGEMRERNRLAGFGYTTYSNYAAALITGRDEYVLSLWGGAGQPTKIWTYQSRTNSWWPGETATEVTAWGEVPDFSLNATGVQAIAGCKTDSGATLRLYREGQADAVGTPTYMLETDDLDHGAPLTLKTPARVAVWPVAAMTNLVVDVRADAAVSYAGADAQQTKSPAARVATWYDFQPGRTTNSAIAAAAAHRYKISGSTLRLGLFALMIRALVGGEKEYT